MDCSDEDTKAANEDILRAWDKELSEEQAAKKETLKAKMVMADPDRLAVLESAQLLDDLLVCTGEAWGRQDLQTHKLGK